jgi:hypothetical protein
MTRATAKKKRGRPLKPVDTKIVERLAMRQASLREIAWVVDMSESGLRERLERDSAPRLRTLNTLIGPRE